jgi:CheY-like chemotaxis protein
LIVDGNVGFATMLQESLEQDGNYRTSVAYSGSEALGIVAHETFDLAIVDLGIDAPNDLDGATVARKLRQKQTNLRLMLIPLEGDELPAEVADLDVQSVLSKPFFLPDLPELIESVLAQSMAELPQSERITESDAATVKLAADVRPEETSYAGSPDVIRELEDLAQEIGAEAVLLTHNEEVLVSVGQLSTEIVSELAQITQDSYRSSNRIAEVLGRERRHFEQSLEGGDYMLYSLSVIEDVILSVALRSAVALGIVRHRAKAAAKCLRDKHVPS